MLGELSGGPALTAESGRSFCRWAPRAVAGHNGCTGQTHRLTGREDGGDPLGMSKPEVWRAGPSDAPVIGQLLHDFNREYDEPTPEPPRMAERARQLFDSDGFVVLLVREDATAADGLAVLRFRPAIASFALECYLAELYVVPAKRGRGIGRALMTEVLKLARAEGADHIDLGTSEDDEAARHLYESLGFINREGGPDGPIMYFYEREL